MSGARAVRPEDVLPDEVDVGTMNGVSVRKGFIARSWRTSSCSRVWIRPTPATRR
jgi:hypothetical protein